MRSLPLYHRIAGQPVVVLGEGAAAEPKRRLVERAGGRVVTDLATGIDHGARLAFIAHDDAALCEGDAIRARGAGLLVNVVDRPALCDFTVPSLLERDPVLIAVGTSGASAGLAKHLRLRLEALLPASIGALASALEAAKARLRARFPDPAARRRAIDAALGEGGALDPLRQDSAARVEAWLAGAAAPAASTHEIRLTSADPGDLTLRQARLLGMADAVIADAGVPEAILQRARADAARLVHPHAGPLPDGTIVVLLSNCA
jgi:uroporphyrin-III C-methyltransferase/precorrin-2 dehydrogenase/sirohydrochlorin ferrochelatase